MRYPFVSTSNTARSKVYQQIYT